MEIVLNRNMQSAQESVGEAPLLQQLRVSTPLVSRTTLKRSPLKDRPIYMVIGDLFPVLDESTKNLCVEIFNQVTTSGQFPNNKRHVLVFASIAAACKEGGFPLGIKEIAKVARGYDITISAVFQHTNAITRMRNVKTGPVDPLVFLDRAARELSVTDETTAVVAKEMIDKLKKTGFNCGRLQRLTCMLALHIASPEQVPLPAVFRAPGIGRPIARALLSEMEKRLEPNFSPTPAFLRISNPTAK